MSLQTIKPISIISPAQIPVMSAFVSRLIDATGEKYAAIIQVPKTGTISKIGFRTGAITTSQTLRGGLETVDAATGAPTGTQYGGSAVGTNAGAFAANTFYQITLGTGATTATAGDIIAAVIQFDSTVGSLNITDIDYDSAFPYSCLYTTIWTKNNRTPCISLEYSDGSYEVCQTMPVEIWAATAFNSGSTPDERGIGIILPFTCRVKGACGWVQGTGDFQYVLYEGLTSPIQRAITNTIDTDVLGNTGFSRQIKADFTSPYILAANTDYFLTVKPTTTTNVSLWEMTVTVAACMDSFELGQKVYHGSRTDAGNFSTNTLRRAILGLTIDQLDDGAGGGITSSHCFIIG